MNAAEAVAAGAEHAAIAACYLAGVILTLTALAAAAWLVWTAAEVTGVGPAFRDLVHANRAAGAVRRARREGVR